MHQPSAGAKAMRGASIACAKCGQLNAGGTLFCVKCNAPVSGIPAGEPGERPRDTSNETTAAGSSTPAPTLPRGTRLAAGRYEVVSILGEGGMGAVYKARDHEVDRLVAIKVIQPQL